MIPGTLIIVFGATGDLARQKLLPAIQLLIQHNPQTPFFIIGVAKEPYIDQQVEPYSVLGDRLLYQQLNAANPEDYKKLEKVAGTIMEQKGLKNKLLYCAVGSNLYKMITIYASEAGLLSRSNNMGGKDMIVYEKPFGTDLDSAREINQTIAQYLDESQVFRIDHYLTKSLVTSLLLLRFSNSFFKAFWSRQWIKQVQIIFSEKVSIAGRGLFFDIFGMLKDVVQNHVIQLLSLIALDEPQTITIKQVKEAKAKVVSRTRFVRGILGQYEGYQQEKGVAQGSQTDTFVALELAVDHPNWTDVPFLIKAGKSLDKKATEIHIILKEQNQDIFGAKAQGPNSLILRISPQGGFQLDLTGQKPNTLYEAAPIALNYDYAYTLGQETHSTYELVLQQILIGDQILSVSMEEIEAAWNIIDNIKKQQLPLYTYTPGGKGPSQSDTFITNGHWGV